MLSSIASRDLPFLWFQPLMLSSIGSRGLMLCTRPFVVVAFLFSLMLSSIGSRGLMLMLSSICSRGLAILAYALVHL